MGYTKEKKSKITRLQKKGRKKSLMLPLFAIILFLLSGAAPGRTAEKAEQPLWEFGLGAAVVTMPAYRGSQNQEFYPAPLPYIIYRGDFLKIDRQGIRGLIYDSPRTEVNLSADGAVPSTSDKGDVREGMPDLDAVGELGPSINYLLYEGKSISLHLRLPVRAAFATDFTSIEHAGWKVHPQVKMDASDVLGQWNVGLTLGPVFADKKYHAYYYEVKPAYATDARPAWRANGGYSGTSVQVSASRRFGRLWLGMFARYDNLAEAAFMESPLVETRHSFMGGIGAAWMLGESSETVAAAP
ncbi:MAG: MipA/OmpV family protein [Desulfobacteraceae bacterium]|nr:MipA/OmpV family protein [Desulfobacteraceae bacterium]